MNPHKCESHPYRVAVIFKVSIICSKIISILIIFLFCCLYTCWVVYLVLFVGGVAVAEFFGNIYLSIFVNFGNSILFLIFFLLPLLGFINLLKWTFYRIIKVKRINFLLIDYSAYKYLSNEAKINKESVKKRIIRIINFTCK